MSSVRTNETPGKSLRAYVGESAVGWGEGECKGKVRALPRRRFREGDVSFLPVDSVTSECLALCHPTLVPRRDQHQG